MGSTSTNEMTNGEFERSDTAPWASGGGGAASATDAVQAKSGKRTGGGSVSDRSKVWILLDRSGSMSGLEAAVVKGVNRFIAEQAAEPGSCRLTVAQFDSEAPFEVLVDDVSVHKADPHVLEQYEPRGLTPLFDAVGRLIGCADRRVKQRRKAGKKPEDQTVVIWTDGYENASTDYSAADIHELIGKRREQGWAFVFMGANQDSYAESARLGVDQRNVQNYEASDEGVGEAFASVSRAYSQRRAMSSTVGTSADDDFFGGVREAEEGMRRRSRGD
ncbi:vWA domain-containing protein [Candidatus Poriferisodalis sp.]|uniref:vWA domain-containing protein n=1 Tax=Candidatus Poriferisodalis sp. TaxID=3101277 RepID=UPI003B01F003